MSPGGELPIYTVSQNLHARILGMKLGQLSQRRSFHKSECMQLQQKKYANKVNGRIL